MAGNDSVWLPSTRSAAAFTQMFLQSLSTSELVRYAGLMWLLPNPCPEPVPQMNYQGTLIEIFSNAWEKRSLTVAPFRR